MIFSQASFQPQQTVAVHEHKTMYEIFYVHSGQAIFEINKQKIKVKQNDCLIIEPGEFHAQKNPFKEPVGCLYWGIATD